MTKIDKNKRVKSCLKNTKAKLKRRDEENARLKARVAELEEAQKKTLAHTMDQVLQSIAELSPDTSSRNSSSGMQSHSCAKQTAALEMLLRLLKH